MRLAALLPLEIFSDAFEINNRLNTNSFELLWIANTTSLQNQGGAQCTTTDDDLLAHFDDRAVVLFRGEGLGRNNTDTNCTSVFDDHLVYLGVAHQVQVLVDGSRAMDVCVGTFR